ncbi:MAG: ROK family protein [Candidatus Omnitrophica bacterium]|nr:ROK family protein [Candidatus Omnitrophota bacterium]MDD5236401.1 ROK family protein [Candidatus Omnitrophota bacterium]MDD5611010.1 ROK family protein [Candidatus Omnitrophota bacterium]
MSLANFKDEELSERERRNLLILENLRRHGPLSRPEISQGIGLNVVTVSNYIDEQIKRNLVFEKELDVSEGGRRPVLLDLNAQAGFAIGVGLNLMNAVGVLIDLKGNIITKTSLDRPRASVKEIVDCILQLIRELLKRSKNETQGIKGIGVGIAGLVNKKDSSVHWPERVGENYVYASINLPLKGLLEKEFGLPATIENDATAACFGEQWIGLEPEIKNAVYMYSGVGCGIMINGQIYTGTDGYAGELAVHSYSEENSFNCAFGNSCFLKRWEIDLGMREDFRKRQRGKDASLKEIFDFARNNHPIAQEVLATAAVRLGIKIASLVNLLNPQVVVIGGGLEEAGDAFLHKVRDTVKEWAFREITQDLSIMYSKLRENSVACGAASLVVRKVFAGI